MVGVVLFVQLVPKLLKANMADEVAKLTKANSGETRKELTGLVEIDNFGFAPFAIAVLCGIIVGGIKIPMGNSNFSLGTTGGPLIMALILAHFGHIGPLNMRVNVQVLKIFREFGLVLFLLGAGVEGGVQLVQQIQNSEYGLMIVLYGFIAGILSSNHDVTDLFVDGTLKICGDLASFEALAPELNKLASKLNVNLVMTVSTPLETASEIIRQFV